MFGVTLGAYCSFPQFRGKARFFRLLSSWVPYQSVRSWYGPKLVRMPGDSTHSYCATGSYGSFVANAVVDIDADAVFLDIGANQGLFALIAARAAPYHKVLALEPNPKVFSCLVRNLEINHTLNVVPLCVGISPRPGLCELKVVRDNSGLSTFSISPQHNLAFERIVTLLIEGDALSDLLPAELPIICKIDVEGYESEVLKSIKASKWLPRIKRIIIEISLHVGNIKNKATVLEDLAELGFYCIKKSSEGSHYDAIFERH